MIDLVEQLVHGLTLGSLYAMVATGLALMVIVFFWHSRMGVMELIEDYVHEHGNKFAATLALALAIYGGMAFGLFCIAKIAFGGGAA